MVVFFTGTGNSRYAARLLAHGLGDEILDAGAYIKANRRAELHSERPWVFVCPTYAWRLPRIFEQFIREGDFSGSREAWFVMTCGDDIGNAGARIETLCREKDLAYKGVLEVVMPENYLAMYPVPDQEEAARIIAAARPVLEEAVKAIAQGQPFPEKDTGLVDRLKTGLVNPIFYRFMVRSKPFWTTEACTACGVCQAACPLQNVRLEEGAPRWSDTCTHCMACICTCPAQAIEYGRATRGKPRYRCPEYQGP